MLALVASITSFTEFFLTLSISESINSPFPSFLISNEGERISGQTIPVDGNAIRLD